MCEEERNMWNASSGCVECAGCKELRVQLDDLKRTMMGTSSEAREEDAQCMSSFISERQQMEIDRMLMELRRKAERFEEQCNEVAEEKRQLSRESEALRKQLSEKADEAAVLSVQNSVYARDFRMERQDREKTHGKLVEIEQQLAQASQRIVDLEDENQRLRATVTALRHQPTNVQQPNVSTGRSLPTSPAAGRPQYTMPTYNIFYPSQNARQNDVRTRQCHHGNLGLGFDECDGLNLSSVDNESNRQTVTTKALYQSV